MAYYEPQGWQAPMRQASWEASAPPSRSGIDTSATALRITLDGLRLIQFVMGDTGTSSTVQREPETNAFASQFDGMDRY